MPEGCSGMDEAGLVLAVVAAAKAAPVVMVKKEDVINLPALATGFEKLLGDIQGLDKAQQAVMAGTAFLRSRTSDDRLQPHTATAARADQEERVEMSRTN